jgi:hypothetical protein
MSSVGKIRALCARLLKARGEEFEAALEELDQAITAHIFALDEVENEEGAANSPRERRP